MLRSLTIWTAAVVAVLLSVPAAQAQFQNETRPPDRVQTPTLPLVIEICGADTRQGFDGLVKVLTDAGVQVGEIQLVERQFSSEETVVRAMTTIATELNLCAVAKQANEFINQHVAIDNENGHLHGMYVVLFADLEVDVSRKVADAVDRLPGIKGSESRVAPDENSIFVKFQNATERRPRGLGDASEAAETFTRGDNVTIGMIITALKDTGVDARTQWDSDRH
ncbi:MAG TPA: hypothetical protein PKD54_15145 [Pirellulaceae bacterium]|nr:hypothetical protein [Pirellulaceae bacterium]